MSQKIKRQIARIPFVRNLYFLKKTIDFNKDKKFFIKNYMYSKPVAKEKLEYDMIFQVHKLEKGFSVTKNLRPFGLKEVKKIITDLKKYENADFERSFAYNLAYSSLEAYLNFYKDKGWVNEPQYILVKDFMKGSGKKYSHISVGAFDYVKEKFMKDASVDYGDFVSSRRSVRNFSSGPLRAGDINKAVEIAIKTPTACNRQMCKIYYVKSNKNKQVIEKYGQGLGLFDLSNANYFVMTFDVNANHFIGERNQGWFNAGLVAMNFINGLHSLGIGSCCIQFGNTFKEERDFKEKLDIPESERVAVIIAAGYYADLSRIPYSARKPVSEIYRER